jgi:predicted PurR-regulated permease PerM/CheY-like chemotaxis protein
MPVLKGTWGKGDKDKASRVQLDIDPIALLKLVIAVALTFLVIKIFNIILLIFLGFLLAVSLEPIAQKLQKLGLKRSLSVAVIALTVSGMVIVVGVVLIPSIFNQVSALIKGMPDLKESVMKRIPGDSPFKNAISKVFTHTDAPDTSTLMTGALSVTNTIFEGLSEVFLILIFSIYLLVDGKRAFKWFSDFFAAPTRLKLLITSKESSVVIHGYVIGQVVTSLASATYAFIVLSILKVPGALTLAVLAGILDILPILGFFMAVVPAILLALTVSPFTGLLVFGLYVAYHAVENYVIVPWVYGTSMAISSLVVMIALLVAGTVGGILGAIAILPVVASYPIIERIWLIKYLGRQVVSKHAEDEDDVEPMSDQLKMWSEKPAGLNRPAPNLFADQNQKGLDCKILIVEDDDDIRAMLKDILETEGYESLMAANGKEGLAVLETNADVGLILLDLGMPIMNGREFLDRVKATPRFSEIPVVFLSGSATEINSVGAVRVLKKPSEIDLVLDIVDQCYRRPPNV